MARLIPVIAFVLVSSIASATVLVPAEFREIVGGAQIIVHARVVDVRPEWANGRRWIDTVVTADVVSYFKGDTGERSVTFKVPGGELGRFRSVVVGAPAFKRGDEAVFFLKQQTDDLPNVFGLNQGLFRIRIDATTGQRVVVPPPTMKADASSPEPYRLTRGALDRRPLRFDAFGARVREVMGAAPRAAR